MRVLSNIIRSVFFLLLICLCIDISGQSNDYITKPKLKYNNSNLTIEYEIKNPNKTNYHYYTWLTITDAKGNYIKPQTLSGDIGYLEEDGKKQIIWDLEKDGMYLDEEITVQVKAEVLSKTFNKTKMLGLSTLFPGWGLTKVKEKPYWIIGVVGYSSLAGAVWFNERSSSTYNKYLNSTEKDKMNEYFDQSMEEYRTAEILSYSTIAIWAVNLVWMALTPNRYESPEYSKYNRGFTIKMDKKTQAPLISYTIYF